MKKKIFLLGAFIVAVALVMAPARAETAQTETTQSDKSTIINVYEGATINYSGSLEGGLPAADIAKVQDGEVLGLSTQDKLVINDYLCFNKEQNTSTCTGFRWNGSTMQVKETVGGSWSSIGATPIVGGGWIADATNNRMYPTSNASGDLYPLVLGTTATATPATVNTELYVGGGGEVVIEGVTKIGGAFTASSSAVIETDLTVLSGARIGGGSTGTHITAGADDSFFVEGQSEFDGIAWFDGSFRASSTAMITGAITASSTLTVSGAGLFQTTLTVTGATTLSNTLAVTGATTLSSTLAVTTSVDSPIYKSSSGAISFDDDNVTGSGNIQMANAVFTGSLTVDTDTLYVNNSSNRVGIGTTTPYATFSIDTNAGDNSFVIGSSTATILTVESDYDLNYKSGAFFLDYSSGYVGLGTTTPFTALAITNTGTQFALAYDATNYSTFAISSGGDLTIAPSGSDVSITGNLSATAVSVASTTAPTIPEFNASGTAVSIGNGTPLKKLLFGSCTVTIGSVIASTTAMATCTATGVVPGDKVVVIPYINNPSIIFNSASSTAADTIQVAVYNTGWVSGASGVAVNPNDNSWTWMAMR